MPREASTPARAAIVAAPRFAEATVSTYEGSEPPSFAPVVSLTEAQLQRQLAGRSPQRSRATVNRA